MRRPLLLALLPFALHLASAQTEPLPEKLKKLQDNYNAAIARASAPITATYLKELERVKLDYTKSGDLKAALATDELIKEAETAFKRGGSGSGKETVTSLAGMNERQFKKWLSTVVISEVESPSGNQYTYVNEVVNSIKSGMTAPRIHPIATVEVGKLIVPFTSTTATIVIDPSLTKAEVTFTTGGKYQATITKKKE